MTQLAIGENAQRLVIYIGEADRWRGKPLYAALLETLKSLGLAGATVTRGVAGFGAHSRIHTAAILRLSEDLPLRIEVIDSRANIQRALETVAPMVSEGLITVDDVQVVKYTHRYLNPLPADRLVAEAMTRPVISLTPELSLAAAWDRMLKHNLKALPVVNADNEVVGVLTDEDLLERAGVGQRLAVAERLDAALLNQELERLAQSPFRVATVMSHPPITATPGESLAVAAARMAKAGVKRLPVVDEHGKLVGVLARIDVLKQVADAQTRRGKKPLLPDAGRVVQDVMTRDIPAVSADADLAQLVNAFVAADTHRLIVVDPSGRPLGLVSDADVVGRLEPAQQRSALDALQHRGPAPADPARARDLMSPEVLTVTPETPLTVATQKMLGQKRKWMIVADAQGKPLGLLDRQALLRAVSGSAEIPGNQPRAGC
jgi:CBS domain-containing protein